MQESDEGDSSDSDVVARVVAQLSTAQLLGTLDERTKQMAAELRQVRQMVGLIPPSASMAPRARTYQLRTLITVGAAVASGALFDKCLALLAAWIGN